MERDGSGKPVMTPFQRVGTRWPSADGQGQMGPSRAKEAAAPMVEGKRTVRSDLASRAFELTRGDVDGEGARGEDATRRDGECVLCT